MRVGAYVERVKDRAVGIVREVRDGKVKASFRDSPKKSRWYPDEEVVLSTSLAPMVKDLQFHTRQHPDTKFVYALRDTDFRGDQDPGPVIECAEDVFEYFSEMGWCDQEHLVVGLLDTRLQLLGWKIVHQGAIDNVQASGKDMIKDAMHANARYLFILHNHPSGDPVASDADADLTDYVQDELDRLGDIDLFDHVVIGRDGLDPESRSKRSPYFSFREEGLLPAIEEDKD
jgi:DNA repair protein RadC